MFSFVSLGKKLAFAFVSAIAAASAPAIAATIYASSVVSSSGLGSSSTNSWNDPAAALGAPTTDEEYGAINPFNPPFETNDIVIIPAGGNLELSLPQPAVIGSAPALGVFVNNGLIDVSSGGSGVAGSPAAYFSAVPVANVSVSLDGTTWYSLGSISFDLPTNAYLDTEISGYYQPSGTELANFGQPFTGSLSDFSGKDYDQIRALLNGSGGGNWLNLSGTGLSSFQYVDFSVPAGSGERMVIDAISAQAVPEPGTLALAAPLVILAVRGKRGRGGARREGVREIQSA